LKFWDASAILPLCFKESHTRAIEQLIVEDEAMVAWWGSLVECYSALERLRREGSLDFLSEGQASHILKALASGWTEVEPTNEVRQIARRLLRLHPLRAADSLQLAAALIWAEKNPFNHGFVCLDERLREAAKNEGFFIYPSNVS